jgi:Fe-S cluster assembly protein SufD
MAKVMERADIKATDQHLAKFERFSKELAQAEWIAHLRHAGIARFAELGFPTTHDEDWRFTNIAPLTRLPFKPVLEAYPDNLAPEVIAGFPFGRLAATRLVFVNGHFAPTLSVLPPQQKGVTVQNLAAAMAVDSKLLESHLASLAPSEQNAFAALNTAFFQDGTFVNVPPEQSVEGPIHLLFIATAAEPGATSNPRNLIIAGRNSKVTILESYVSTVDAPYFTNAVTDLVLGEGAVVEHAKLQDESASAFHIAAVRARLGRGCNLISHSIATGAHLSRNNIRTTLAGEGVECVLNGLYLTHGDQLADHHMVVEHASPHCNSHEYYNGILEGKSKGVFHGRILVRQAAQKTDAKQTNKNLLLSENATVDTKPQLEIYADDVKCTHGATIGQLNEESIFYLRARGIGAERARRMLIHAFAGEIIERIRHPEAREELDKRVWDRLEANPNVADEG